MESRVENKKGDRLKGKSLKNLVQMSAVKRRGVAWQKGQRKKVRCGLEKKSQRS